MAKKQRHRHLERLARRIQDEDDVDWMHALREARRRRRVSD